MEKRKSRANKGEEYFFCRLRQRVIVPRFVHMLGEFEFIPITGGRLQREEEIVVRVSKKKEEERSHWK